MTLIEALQSVPDYRKARGERQPLWIMFVTIVMGNLAGYRVSVSANHWQYWCQLSL